MNKELLNKILPYCGHELKVIDTKSKDIYKVDISKYIPIDIKEILSIKNSNVEDGVSICQVIYDPILKPILFHPYCLTREIKTEYGKEITLVELWKICYGKEQLLDDPSFETGEYDSRISCNGLVLVFNYYHGFYTIQHGEVSFAENQWQLFLYLYSRHIAFNLLPNEYVDVQSLEENPYSKIAEK